jgi:hypothetical protein
MDTTRLVNLVLADLSVENLKLQEELEREFNENIHINTKVFNVKDTLKEMALNEIMMAKFQQLLKSNQKNDNNDNLNEKENG